MAGKLSAGVAPPVSSWDAEVYAWIQTTNGGMGLAIDAVPRPGGSTTGEGLAALFGAASWPAEMMQEGVDFGRRSSQPTPTDFSAHPEWDSINSRIFLKHSTLNVNRIIENYSGTDASIEVGVLAGEATIRDCIIDGALEVVEGVASGQILGIDHDVAAVNALIVATYSTILGQTNDAAMVRQCLYDRLHVHSQGSDAFRYDGIGAKRIKRTFVRNLGIGGAEVHADSDQTSETTGDFIGFRRTLYMPGESTTYHEGAIGTTNLLNWNTDRGDLSDLMEVDSLLIGGGYTVNLCPDPGDRMDGAALIGCWFAKEDYRTFGSFYTGAVQIGVARSILVHNCRYAEDGSPVLHFGVDANGLWDYEKATAPANFKKVCKILGYLDDNDDPLVTVRTGFHTGTEV